jgi:predicted dehydrogenase
MRFALFGFGTAGRDLARALRASGFELVGISDPSPARVDSAALAANLPAADLLDPMRLGCDAVAVALPLHERFPIVRSALRAGCHVIVDGLPAGSPEEILELEAIATRSGRALVAGPALLLTQTARRIQQLAHERDAGNGVGLRAWRTRARAPRRVRDLLEAVALPDLVLFSQLANAGASAISARAIRSPLSGQVDRLELSVWYPTGWPTRLEIRAQQGNAPGLAVVCERRRMLLDTSRTGRLVLWIEDSPWSAAGSDEAPIGLRREVEFAEPMQLLCESFGRALAAPAPPQLGPLAAALRLLRTAEQQIDAQHSAESRAA